MNDSKATHPHCRWDVKIGRLLCVFALDYFYYIGCEGIVFVEVKSISSTQIVPFHFHCDDSL